MIRPLLGFCSDNQPRERVTMLQATLSPTTPSDSEQRAWPKIQLDTFSHTAKSLDGDASNHSRSLFVLPNVLSPFSKGSLSPFRGLFNDVTEIVRVVCMRPNRINEIHTLPFSFVIRFDAFADIPIEF